MDGGNNMLLFKITVIASSVVSLLVISFNYYSTEKNPLNNFHNFISAGTQECNAQSSLYDSSRNRSKFMGNLFSCFGFMSDRFMGIDLYQ